MSAASIDPTRNQMPVASVGRWEPIGNRFLLSMLMTRLSFPLPLASLTAALFSTCLNPFDICLL